MRIAYFGGDMFYTCMEFLLQNGHEIIALFTAPPNKGEEYDSTQNVRRQAEALGIPVIFSKPTEKNIRELQQKGCDMILSAGYPYKIPKWQGGCTRYGVNIHPSLLPEGAGPMSMPLVIIKGLKKTGVTLHKLSPEWDAGDIILQESIPLFGNENLEGLLCESQILAPILLQRFLKAPCDLWGKAIPQNRQDIDYWPMPRLEAFFTDYSKDLETINRHLRVHRKILLDGNIELISDISVWEQKHELKAGTVLLQNNGLHLIATKDGLVSFKIKSKSSPKYNLVNPIKLAKNF